MTLHSIHASAVVIGETGVILLGASGSGKSSLALALIAAAQARGDFAGLVGDDRIQLEAHGGRLIARGHPVIAGRIEARGAGILALEPLDAARIDVAVQLEPQPERLPDKDAIMVLEGVRLPLLTLRDDQDLSGKAGVVMAWLAQHLQARGI